MNLDKESVEIILAIGELDDGNGCSYTQCQLAFMPVQLWGRTSD